MKERSTKPYLIRAIYEWCVDSGLTPYLSVQVDENTRVPQEYVKNGEIVLNVSADATHRLTLGNDLIQFAARFSGVSRELSIPVDCVKAIFARENGQGLFFQAGAGERDGTQTPIHTVSTAAPAPEPEGAPPDGTSPGGTGKRPRLQVVK